MHDWSLDTILVDWAARTASLRLRAPDGSKSLVAHGLRMLLVPMGFEWGPSVSVNSVEGSSADGCHQRLRIEMQSGDIIEMVAELFEMPE